MSVATISAKGRVVIPVEYRRKYNLRPGDKVAFVDYGRVLSIARLPSDPIAYGRGLLAGGPSLTRALLKERREERRREDRKCARFSRRRNRGTPP